MEPGENFVLGVTAGKFEVVRSEALREIGIQMVAQAGRSLDLVSRHLDPQLYDQEPLLRAVKKLVLGASQARVRILLLDAGPVVSRGHRLIRLAQQFSGFIEIRVPGRTHRQFNEAWLVADGTGYAWRELSDRYQTEVDFSDRRQSAQLTRRFDELWSRGQPHMDLRQLHL